MRTFFTAYKLLIIKQLLKNLLMEDVNRKSNPILKVFNDLNALEMPLLFAF